MPRRARHLRRRHLNPRFVVFCITVFFAIAGIIVCIVALSGKKDTPPVEQN